MNTSSTMTGPTIRIAARRGIANWRVGVLWMVATLIPTLIVTLPISKVLAEALDHSIFAGEWAQRMNLTIIIELINNSTEFAPALAGAAVMSVLTTLLFWPLLSAIIVTTSAEAQPAGFAALLSGGVRAYGRMFRMLLWSIIPLGLALAIGGAVMHWARKIGEHATLQSTGDHAHTAAVIFLLVLFIIAHTTLEAGRAQLALDGTRRSAVKAWWRGVKLVKNRPLATFGSYLVITMTGLVLMALIGVLRINLSHSSFLGIVVAFVLTQLIVLAAVWMRSARLFAMFQIGANFNRV
jgi:hypothetical protein